METFIKKADTLIEALPYIKTFQGAAVVVKYGGSAMGDKDTTESVLKDIVFMRLVGMRPILVHGGGPAISQKLKELGRHVKFLEGYRVTDEETLQIVDQILSELNSQMVKQIKRLGGSSAGLLGKDKDLIKAKRYRKDMGYVGQILSISPGPIKRLIRRGSIPVISPVARGEAGEIYNVNADQAASSIAQALKAEKMVLLTDVEGILRFKEDPSSVISTLQMKDVEDLIERGVIEGGMIPKVRACTEALKGGVNKTHIVDARLPHSLLLEIFTQSGVGTEIVTSDAGSSGWIANKS